MLRKVLLRASLKYEELVTVLCDCECIINNRPITYVSDDIKDAAPLTPSMFLHELPMSGVPELDTIDQTAVNKRVKYLQKLRDDLRKRFRSEYLGELRQPKNKKLKLNELSVGDVVLVEDQNKKRSCWSLARITELIKGKDGLNRLARIKVGDSELLRPVQRLYLLELDNPVSFPKSNTEVICKYSRYGRKVKAPDRFTSC